MKAIYSALAALLLSGCCFAAPCVEGSALVHIFREKAYIGSALSRSVYFDQMQLAKISNGSYFQACLPAGMHHLRVDDNPHGNLEVQIDPKAEYFLQVQIPLAMWKAHWEIVQVEEPLASSIMERLDPLNPDKVKAPDYVMTSSYHRSAPNRPAAEEIESLRGIDEAKLFDIKGDRLGATLEDFSSHHSAPYCATHAEASVFLTAAEAFIGIVGCAPASAPYEPALARWTKTPQPTLGNVGLRGIGYKFYKGHLFSIVAVLSADDYAALRAAIVEKFGQPSSTEVKDAQNRMGAHFENETATWSNGVSSIEMQQRASDLDTAAIVIYLPKVQEEVEAHLPKPKKDL